MSYQQLTQEERYQISAFLKAGFTQSEIATILKRHKSTISREVSRNTGKRGYRPKQAQHFTDKRKLFKAQPRISNPTWSYVTRLIKEDWSPEQISLWLKANGHASVSHEWVYQFILKDKHSGGTLYRHLRCQKKRRKRYGHISRRGQIINRTSISERPPVVDKRCRIGDWELDTIIGKHHKQAIVSLTERKSRFTLIRKVTRKTSDCVTQAILHLLEPIADKVLTLTADNGREFAGHEVVSKRLNAQFYFADPYASWQRGLNENTNGLIRQYFPKNCEFESITHHELKKVMNKLNNRPRKCLGIQTPNQVFLGIDPPVALTS